MQLSTPMTKLLTPRRTQRPPHSPNDTPNKARGPKFRESRFRARAGQRWDYIDSSNRFGKKGSAKANSLSSEWSTDDTIGSCRREALFAQGQPSEKSVGMNRLSVFCLIRVRSPTPLPSAPATTGSFPSRQRKSHSHSLEAPQELLISFTFVLLTLWHLK